MVYNLKKVLNSALESFWLLPSFLVFLSVFLAFGLIYIDELFFDEIQQSVFWLFSGSPTAAQGILIAIAGSLSTIASIVYSIAIISLQQAANNYSPSVLRNFINDRINQFVLGSYVSTIIFAFLILRSVRTDEGGTPFVPALSVAVAIFFTIVDLILLVYFISHIVQSLQATKITNNIYKSLIKQIDRLFPEQIGRAAKEPADNNEIVDKYEKNCEVVEIRSRAAGFVQYYEEDGLKILKNKEIKLLFFPKQVGDFVSEGEIIAKLYGSRGTKEIQEKLFKTISIGLERTEKEDALLSIRQLKDVAIKTMRIDPTTAEYCVNYICSALCHLVRRDFPSPLRKFEGNPTVFLFSRPTWQDFLKESFTEIRKNSLVNAHSAHVVLDAYKQLLGCVTNIYRLRSINEEIVTFKEQLKFDQYEIDERKRLEDLLEEIELIKKRKQEELS